MLDFNLNEITERVTLTKDGVLFDSDGLRKSGGVRVDVVPADDTTTETVEVGNSVYRAENIQFLPDRIRSKVAGWEVLL